jgi:superfamily II DNA or RNA helicase
MTTLYAHQIEMTNFIRRFWATEKAGCLIAAETGTGKTLAVMEFLVAHREKRVLIVVPAIARGEWVRQNSLHDMGLPLVAADTGKKVAKFPSTGGFLLTSYHLLKHVEGPFDIVIGDEIHLVSNPDAGMTKELRRVIDQPDTFLVALSGTPAMDRPDQLWSVLDMLQPGQWGSSIWSFRRKYCEAVPNPWAPSGVVYRGLDPLRAEELTRRVASVAYRVRKSDIAQSLPPLVMSLRYIKPKRSKLDWDNESAFDELLALNSSAKLDATVDVLCAARDSGETHFVAFTYLRQTAEQLGTRLHAAGFAVEVVTGAIPADLRHAPIERVRSATQATALVCNIDAVGVSLDFTFAQTAVFAEMSYVPGKNSQALGRLIRLSSKHACNCIWIVGEGTREMKQAEAFCRKQSSLDQIIASGRDEVNAMHVLSHNESDDDVLGRLAQQ